MNRHLEQYNDQGYAIVKEFLSSDEINRIINELAIIYSLSLNESTSLGCSTGGYSYQNLCDIYDMCANTNEQLKARSYDISKSLAVVCKTATKCSDRLKKIFSDRTFIITGPQVRCDDTVGTRYLDLHQEIMGMKSDTCVTCWMPLLDTNELQGGLKIVPGSHLKGPLQHEWIESPWGNKAHVVRDHKVYESSAVTLTVDAGDALFFHPCLIHGTAENKSKQARWTFVSRFDDIGDIRYLVDESKDNCVSEAKEKYVL